jgi:MurNAc alpha-1-phosphate uridylyltransferase
MKAMILSAGKGTRMRPLTLTTPKPLLKIQEKPLIIYHIEKLASLGIKEIIINIAYLGYQIPKALGDGSFWNISIKYSDEQKEGGLESAGGIIKALALLGEETFIVINGDVFTEYTFDTSYKLKKNILAHLILVDNPKHNPQGDFDLDKDIILNKKAYTFSGIGYYSPKLFENVAYGKLALAPLLRKFISNARITGEVYRGKWVDIGTVERLDETNKQFIGTKI